MPGVFDRLQREIENKQQDGGITALDLADLSPSLRKIMRLMLRELQITYPRLCEAMDGMSDTERLSRADLDAALDTLTKQFWLIRLGEAEHAIYKVNLRRKSGSTLADGIWNNLDAKLKGKPEG
ncbi:MAG: hypothetical protein MUO77_06990 [Anaerolineales bacterium]|nr:hypothetical protein [Anaerolineales bacterium]